MNSFCLILFFSAILNIHQQIYAQKLVSGDCKCKSQLNLNDDQLRNYIVGGSKVSQPVPWTASLAYKNDEGKSSHFCMAVLLNHQWAMTTARCAMRFNNAEQLLRLRLRTGITKLDDKNIGENTYLVKQIVIDERFDNTTTSIGDIGLINIKGSIPFSLNTSPACLVKKNETYFNKMLKSVGWGWEEVYEKDRNNRITPPNLKVSNDLKQARLSYDESVGSECVKSHLLCTKPQKNTKDSLCAGDSGASVHIENNGYSGVLGIFQYTVGKGNAYSAKYCDNSPSVFGRISHHIPTIEKYLYKDYCILT